MEEPSERAIKEAVGGLDSQLVGLHMKRCVLRQVVYYV